MRRAGALAAALAVLLIVLAVVTWLPLRTARERRLASDLAAARLYRAAALTAMDRYAEANAALRAVDRSAVDPRKVAALKKALVQRTAGQWPYVLDREGRTIATYGKTTSVMNPDYEAFIEGAGKLTIAAQKPGTATTIETTLDSTVQHAAMEGVVP